jgi:hypothetical protein
MGRFGKEGGDIFFDVGFGGGETECGEAVDVYSGGGFGFCVHLGG